MKIRQKVILIGVLILLIILAIVLIYKAMALQPKAGSVTTITKTALEDVLEISELSTVENTYNAVAASYEEDGSTVKYYVAYKGIVKAGIDFEKIEISVDEETKRIEIKLPEAEILDCTVEPGKLDYIFMNKKYDVDSTAAEAYHICEKDLRNRSSEEDGLLKLARENAEDAVGGLLQPWIQQVDKEFTVEIK